MIEDVGRRIQQLWQLPHGPARVAATEFLVRQIDNEGPEAALPVSLIELVSAFEFGSPSPQVFAVFSRLVRLYDTRPELFDEYDQHNFFWEYKWVSSDLNAYPEISVAQAGSFLDEMRQRFRLAGFSDCAVDRAWFKWYETQGDYETAAIWRDKWLAHGADEMDCPSCRIGESGRFFLETEQPEKAIEVGIPTEGLCNREPSDSHRTLAYAYLALRNGVAAARHLRRSQSTQEAEMKPYYAGTDFELMALGGHMVTALAQLRDRGQKLLRMESDPLTNLSFSMCVLKGCCAFLNSAADAVAGIADSVVDATTGALTVEEATAWPTYLPQAPTVGELRDWAEKHSRSLAAMFDARNGNTFRADLLQKALENRQKCLLDFGFEAKDTTVSESSEEHAATRTANDAQSRHKEITSAQGDSSAVASQKQRQSIVRSLVKGRWGGRRKFAVPEKTDRPSGAEIYGCADAQLEAQDYAAAGKFYQRAARQFQAEGRLSQAGVALADAAQCHAELQEYRQAQELFTQAWPWLEAGGAEIPVLLKVLTAWGRAAEAVNGVNRLYSPVKQALVAVERLSKQHKQMSRGADAENHESYSQMWLRQDALCRASVLDLQARVMAALARLAAAEVLPSDLDEAPNYRSESSQVQAREWGGEAASLARLATELCKEHGDWARAGRATLVGCQAKLDISSRLKEDGSYTQAQETLQEVATELEFVLQCFRRMNLREEHAQTLNLLVQVLQDSGQEDRLAEVLRYMTE